MKMALEMKRLRLTIDPETSSKVRNWHSFTYVQLYISPKMIHVKNHQLQKPNFEKYSIFNLSKYARVMLSTRETF